MSDSSRCACAQVLHSRSCRASELLLDDRLLGMYYFGNLNFRVADQSPRIFL